MLHTPHRRAVLDRNNLGVVEWADSTKRVAYALIGILAILTIINVIGLAFTLATTIILVVTAAIGTATTLFISVMFWVLGAKVIRRLRDSPAVDINKRIAKMSILLMLSGIGTIIVTMAIFLAGIVQGPFTYHPIVANIVNGLWTLGELITSATQIRAFMPNT